MVVPNVAKLFGESMLIIANAMIAIRRTSDHPIAVLVNSVRVTVLTRC
jgi:hypothetical protein